MKSTVSEQVLVVKNVKSITGTKLSTLIMPNDRVFSCQPDGSEETRDPGAEGQYEKCRVAGSVATFQPVKDKFFTKPFVEVEEL